MRIQKGRQNNMNFNLSDRDKKLGLFVLIAIILFGSFFLFDKLSTANEEYAKEEKQLKDKYDDLTAKNGRRQAYLDETVTFSQRYTDLINGYNTSLSQEQVLVFLGMVEQNTGVWLKQTGLSTISPVYTFGNVTSTNPSTAGQKVYTSDYQGISTQLNLSYECDYDDFKNVLTYLRENGKKSTIGNISFSYSEATKIITGTMQMSLYAITGSDRPAMDVNIKDVPVGTGRENSEGEIDYNIFSSATFAAMGADSSYRDKIKTDYDLYLIMNKVGSDMDTFIAGQKGDPLNEKVVSSNSDGLEQVTIRVTGSEGDYKVSYRVGTSTYPVENFDAGAPLICGEELDLLIMSQPRAGEKDDTKASLIIINESDKPLNAAIINDDVDDPRVVIERTEGTVIFFNE